MAALGTNVLIWKGSLLFTLLFIIKQPVMAKMTSKALLIRDKSRKISHVKYVNHYNSTYFTINKLQYSNIIYCVSTVILWLQQNQKI